MADCRYCGINLEAEKEVFSMDRLFTVHTCRGNLLECTKCGWIGTPEEAKHYASVNHPVLHRQGLMSDFGVEREVKCPKCGETDLI